MMSQQEKAERFKALHIKRNPVILYNIWDPDTAKAVASQGAKALATSHHAITNAYGYVDGESMPLELDLNNMQRIVEAADLPVSVDFETGYGTTPDDVHKSVVRALKTGIVGMNIEDRAGEPGQLRSTEDACTRLAAARQAANDNGISMFLNARTNLYAYAAPKDQNEQLVDQLLERAAAFKHAGSDGFFAPMIKNIDHIRKLCNESPLPVNIIWFPGFPSVKELIDAGASRVSYGPGPYLDMIEWLKNQAKRAFALED